MSTQGPEGPPSTAARVVKWAVIAVLLVAAVFVLFTWVFPWMADAGFSPALDT